jgi:hypothetical protein
LRTTKSGLEPLDPENLPREFKRKTNANLGIQSAEKADFTDPSMGITDYDGK